VTEHRCRACHGRAGQVVLDLGEQPASDLFPAGDDPGPDPIYPLQMWLCARCHLAQLLTDQTAPEEPRGAEPAALVKQAADAVDLVAAAGWLRAGAWVAEYGSPHGGSWTSLLEARGLRVVCTGEPADVVLDVFGLMHEADQAAALAERAAGVAPGGVLLLQYHSLATILRLGQWNSLRHGHFAYYSAAALRHMLATAGFRMQSVWEFDLYGGTVLVAACRDDGPDRTADPSVRSMLTAEEELGVGDPDRLRDLQRDALRSAEALHDWLAAQRAAGSTVIGYGAASRAVALLCRAGLDRRLLPAVADASAAKQGRRMPGTDIPVIGPDDMVTAHPDAVLLFLPDLLAEARSSFPQIEAAGGRWVRVDRIT
jgi:hypothetical protein